MNNTKTARTADIFDTIAARDAAPAAKRFRNVKRYQISYAGKWSARLYPHALARKIVARLNRRGCDSYMSPMMVTIAH